MQEERIVIDNLNEENASRCRRDSYPGKLRGIIEWMKKHHIRGRLMFVLLGVASTVWFLIRVIPKPSRAAYPCMRVAAPMMSSFVLWLLAVTSSVFSFRRFGKNLNNKKYGIAFLFLFLALTTGMISLVVNNRKSVAAMLTPADFTPNQPVGKATGLRPGRVVWVWNPDATNENMTNQPFDYWYQKGNADQTVIDSMLDKGIRDLAGAGNTAQAWDSLFTWFNKKHDRGAQGYRNGEKIVIKLNLTNSVHPGSYSDFYGTTQYPEYMDNTPELVFALLKQLINVYHVQQEDIYVGDNFRAFRNTYWDLCHTVFPDVHYVDGIGEQGREKTRKSATEVLHFSDGSLDLCLPQHYLDAAYLINLAALKTHNAAGITLTAKNHQGSIIKLADNVSGTMNVGYAHASLPYEVAGTGHYRHLVDYMGHKDMGGKTVLFMIDGIWGGRDFWGKIYKWDMPPFNGDYPSSIFLSQDAVAIESVGFDFLLGEMKDKPAEEQFPYMSGVDDYLYQAADSSFWPSGVRYDPEKDGTVIGSLGVYEHWDNAADKKYSRNLGTGEGIELLKEFLTGPSAMRELSREEASLNLFPNPTAGRLNIFLDNGWNGMIHYRIFTLNGRSVLEGEMSKNGGTLKDRISISGLQPGLYLMEITHNGEKITRKIQKI